MSIKDAIKYIKAMAHISIENGLGSGVVDAAAMAVEALKCREDGAAVWEKQPDGSYLCSKCKLGGIIPGDGFIHTFSYCPSCGNRIAFRFCDH